MRRFWNKKPVILFFVLTIGTAGFLFWAGAQNYYPDFSEPLPAENYAPNLWFDSEENYYPTDPFFCAESFEEISGEKCKQKYLDLSFEEKLRIFTVFYYISETQKEWVYEYWLYFVFNDYANEHYYDWESLYVFVDKNTKKITKAVGSAHQEPFLNNEFLNPDLKEGEHIWAYIEKGGHAICPDEYPNGSCNPTNFGAWSIKWG